MFQKQSREEPTSWLSSVSSELTPDKLQLKIKELESLEEVAKAKHAELIRRIREIDFEVEENVEKLKG